MQLLGTGLQAITQTIALHAQQARGKGFQDTLQLGKAGQVGPLYFQHQLAGGLRAHHKTRRQALAERQQEGVGQAGLVTGLKLATLLAIAQQQAPVGLPGRAALASQYQQLHVSLITYRGLLQHRLGITLQQLVTNQQLLAEIGQGQAYRQPAMLRGLL